METTKKVPTVQQVRDIHKLVFMAQEYPQNNIKQLLGLFQMSTFESHEIVHLAVDEGYIAIDQETFDVTIVKTPELFDFGPEVIGLHDTIKYVFQKLAVDETDLQEESMGDWLAGALSHNGIVAVRTLLKEKVLSTYEITVVHPPEKKATAKARAKAAANPSESTYTFYTLTENLDKKFSLKLFPNKNMLK